MVIEELGEHIILNHQEIPIVAKLPTGGHFVRVTEGAAKDVEGFDIYCNCDNEYWCAIDKREQYKATSRGEILSEEAEKLTYRKMTLDEETRTLHADVRSLYRRFLKAKKLDGMVICLDGQKPSRGNLMVANGIDGTPSIFFNKVDDSGVRYAGVKAVCVPTESESDYEYIMELIVKNYRPCEDEPRERCQERERFITDDREPDEPKKDKKRRRRDEER